MTTAAGDILAERFEILGLLGQGGQARTFLARDGESGEQVAIKELSLQQVADWKAIELFEREAKALRNLDHDAVPDYVDAFPDPDGKRFFLVQEFIEGDDLEKVIKRGELFDEADAGRFLHAMLDILEYLHGLSPPVIHRDIKPSNIIVRPDGTYAIIDFGAVQAVAPDTVGGSTIVGTTGYMPPEQLMGRAMAATDIYALAATIIHLATGLHPTDIPMERMKLQFRELAGLSPALSDVLEAMLEPDVRARLSVVEDVREALDRMGRAPARPMPPERPDDSHEDDRGPGPNPELDPVSTVLRNGDLLAIDIPHNGSTVLAWAAAGIVTFMALTTSVMGCLFGSSWSLIGLAMAVIAGPTAYWMARRTMGVSFQRMTLSPEGLEFLVLRLDSKTGDERTKSRMHMTLSEIRRIYLHVVDEPVMEKAIATTGKPPPNMWQAPGIVFVDARNRSHTFGTCVVTRGNPVPTRSGTSVEIRWLYDVVQAHSKSLLSGMASDSEHDVLEVRSTEPAVVEEPHFTA
ncbi:MAG: protein kinase domain-containing protein [Bradymonadaceae bacterium]